MAERPTQLYDWAADLPLAEQQPANLPARRPTPAPLVQVPPAAQVMAIPGQVPYYAYAPAPLPPYDPLPARMYGCGVMAFGIGIGGTGVGFGCYLLFAGMSLATGAVIGSAAAVAAGAVAVVAMRMSGGVRIRNFHQGDGSTFRGGR